MRQTKNTGKSSKQITSLRTTKAQVRSQGQDLLQTRPPPSGPTTARVECGRCGRPRPWPDSLTWRTPCAPGRHSLRGTLEPNNTGATCSKTQGTGIDELGPPRCPSGVGVGGWVMGVRCCCWHIVILSEALRHTSPQIAKDNCDQVWRLELTLSKLKPQTCNPTSLGGAGIQFGNLT